MSEITADTNCSPPIAGLAPVTFAAAASLFHFAASLCNLTEDWPPGDSVEDGATFDFIVVGAGTAGSVVANRLSECEDLSVLLIEAGGDPPVESTIMNLLVNFLLPTKFDWKYYTENDPEFGQGHITGSAYFYPRGKVLGGTGSINGMVYFKGIDYDYEQWYNQGNEEWHPGIIKEYFKKAESLQNENFLADPNISENYGKNGPLVINTPNFTQDIIINLLEAYEEIGMKTVTDLNTAELCGAGPFTVTAGNGRRDSTARAYLNPYQNRPNLVIVKNTLVTKVLINDETKKAIGVEVERDGKTLHYYVNLEVILSAGAFNTPQLLMLSGIGPQKTLESHSIPCIVDSPGVGRNLQDHNIIFVSIFADKPTLRNPIQEAKDIRRYLYDGSGTLSRDVNVMAFYPLNENAKIPDIEYFLDLFPLISTAVYNFGVTLLRPFSRGNVTLKSADPHDSPIINLNFLEDPRDVDNLAAGCKTIASIVNTTFFRSINASVAEIIFASCNEFEYDSFDYWKCVAINYVRIGYHVCGSAKMGSDAESVVDSRLRVHGVEGLRVVDASVMPTIPSCNINAPTIMIAERASDLIKEDNDCITVDLNAAGV